MKKTRRTLALAIFLGAASITGLADTGSTPSPAAPESPGAATGSPEVTFQDFKKTWIDVRKEHMRILQDSIACMEPAQDLNQLRACHDKERMAEMQLYRKEGWGRARRGRKPRTGAPQLPPQGTAPAAK